MGIATATVSSFNAAAQVTTDDPQGQVVGPRSGSLVAFYGGTPVVQQSGNAQAIVTRGQQAGVVATIASTQSPSSVANITTAEKGMTLVNATSVFQLATNDLAYVNKPSSQAGLAVGNVRVSAANVLGVTFGNATSATITPTSSEKYGVVVIRGFTATTASLTPAAIGPNAIVEQTFTVTGIRTGDLIQAMKPTAQAGLDIYGVRAAGNNLVGISFANLTAATITPTAAETYTFISLGGMDGQSNQVVYQSLQSPTSVANATSAEQAFTITGLATTDTITGISKPTAQAGLGIVGMRVSAANSLGITYMNATAATITPTATEVYAVSVYRPNPVAPLVVYTQTISPTSVAPNTTAEQTFSVTGIVASSPIWVNKPTWTSGLGIGGVRASASNQIAINYVNATANTITPPSESYVIGNFQIPIPDAGTTVMMTALPAVQQDSVLGNGMRSALTSLNLIAGA